MRRNEAAFAGFRFSPECKQVIRSSSTIAAFAVAVLGVAFLSGMDAVMKHLVLALGTYNAVLWRTAAVTLTGGLLFLARRNSWPTRTAMRIHLIRGAVGTVMAILFFWGLARVPLAQAIALSFIAPLIALYLAALLLKERIERKAIFASLLGFAGVLVILAGQAEADLGPEAVRGSIAILFSAVLYAWNIILMRQQALIANPVEIVFFTSATATMAYLVAAPFLAVLPAAGEWPAIMGAAFLTLGALMLLSWAYARAEAQHLAPVEYTAFVWAALFGFLIRVYPLDPRSGLWHKGSWQRNPPLHRPISRFVISLRGFPTN